MNDNVDKRTWEEFRNCGMLWWVNMILHTFGWSLVVVKDYGEIIDVFPARVKYRGFSEKSNEEGYINVSEYLKDNAEQLYNESKED